MGTDAGLAGAREIGRHEDPEVLRRRTSFQDDLKGQRENKPRGTKKKGEQQVCTLPSSCRYLLL